MTNLEAVGKRIRARDAIKLTQINMGDDYAAWLKWMATLSKDEQNKMLTLVRAKT